jgi:hypothetical protein
MPTLNRFPLLGLWAREAARRCGYTKSEAEALGHAYAVLYAIRANKRPKTAADGKAAEKPTKKPRRAKHLRFGGDDLEVTYDPAGRVQGKVGGDKPQTARSFQTAVRRKFPPGYFEGLEHSFRRVFKTVPPRMLRGRMVYDLYDEWKKTCGQGRLVDLDKLQAWCEERAAAAT